MFSFCSTTIPGYPTPFKKKSEQKETAVTCEHVTELIKHSTTAFNTITFRFNSTDIESAEP